MLVDREDGPFSEFPQFHVWMLNGFAWKTTGQDVDSILLTLKAQRAPGWVRGSLSLSLLGGLVLLGGVIILVDFLLGLFFLGIRCLQALLSAGISKPCCFWYWCVFSDVFQMGLKGDTSSQVSWHSLKSEPSDGSGFCFLHVLPSLS